MNQDFSRTTTLQNLSDVNRLFTYVGQHAIDSEQMPIRPDEVPTIINQLIQQLVGGYPYLDQVLQELLNELRFCKSKDPL